MLLLATFTALFLLTGTQVMAEPPQPTEAVTKAIARLNAKTTRKPCKPAKVIAKARYWPGLTAIARALPWEDDVPKCLTRAITKLDAPRHLRALLDAPERTERLAAMAIPLHLPGPEWGPTLAKATAHADEMVRTKAAIGYTKHPVDADRRTGLAALMGDSTSTVRNAAAEALGKLGGDWAVALLEKALAAEKDENTRIFIQRALKLARR